jgi:hypothetical protein
MADYSPTLADITATYTAGATITAGQALVFTAADTVSPSSGASQAFAGIAGHDAASGAPVTVHMGAGAIHETASTASAVAVGGLIQTAAAGAIASGATAGQEIGIAIRAVSGSGGTVRWKATKG